MRFFISAVVGMLLALAVGAIALALAPFIDAVGFYIAPAKIVAPIIGPLIPSSMMYRLAPDGGVACRHTCDHDLYALFLDYRIHRGSFCLALPVCVAAT
jgi:hypothetical protein